MVFLRKKNRLNIMVLPIIIIGSNKNSRLENHAFLIMKKYKIILFAFIAALVAFTSCEDFV